MRVSRLLPIFALVVPAFAASPADAADKLKALQEQCSQFHGKQATFDACTAIIDGKYSKQVRAEALLQRGQSLSYLNDFDGADADFTAALKLMPDDANALYYRGLVNVSRDPQSAIFDFTAYLDAYEPDADVLSLRGQAFVNAGETKLALADFSKSLSLERDPSGYIGRGRANFAAGDMTNALSDFDRAVSLTDGHSADAADALLYRGLARMAGGKMAEAADDLAKAVDAATYGVASYVVWADIAARRAGLRPPNQSSPDIFKPDEWPGMFFRVAAGKESGAEVEAAIAAIYADQPALAAARLYVAEARRICPDCRGQGRSQPALRAGSR